MKGSWKLINISLNEKYACTIHKAFIFQIFVRKKKKIQYHLFKNYISIMKQIMSKMYEFTEPSIAPTTCEIGQTRLCEYILKLNFRIKSLELKNVLKLKHHKN